MRYLLSIFSLIIMLSGCSTVYDKGRFENKLMRAELSDRHATMERFDGAGTALEAVSRDSLFPKFWIGKYSHTQMYLPIMNCTTYFDKEGLKEKEECSFIPQMSVEAQANAKGGRIGDIIKTGEAVKYPSSFDYWIESLRKQVIASDIDDRAKNDYLTVLNGMEKELKHEE